MKRWIVVSLILGCMVLFSTGSVFAQGANIARGNGCNLPDANLTIHSVAECPYQIVLLPDGRYNLQGHATLPPEAVLPAKAFSVTAEQAGLFYCLNPGDQSKITVTPSGRVNISCQGP